MSYSRKPPIFEDLDEKLFSQLPPSYRLMETGGGLGMQIAECDFYSATMPLDAFHRPMSKIMTSLEEEA